jgi:hypothetical protein
MAWWASMLQACISECSSHLQAGNHHDHDHHHLSPLL